MLPDLLPGDAEHAHFGLLGCAWEQDLGGVDVAVGDRALAVPRLRLHVSVALPAAASCVTFRGRSLGFARGPYPVAVGAYRLLAGNC